jgi:hypothetical protein
MGAAGNAETDGAIRAANECIRRRYERKHGIELAESAAHRDDWYDEPPTKDTRRGRQQATGRQPTEDMSTETDYNTYIVARDRIHHDSSDFEKRP